MNTKIKFLGAGSAFSYENGQNNILIEIEDGATTHTMAVDVGTQWHDMTMKVLKEPMFKLLEKIDSIFITHIHADHVGGLEEIAFMTRFAPNLHKIKLYAPVDVLRDLWESTLKGGLESLNYGQMTDEEEMNMIGIDSYFDPRYLCGNEAITIGATKIEPFTTVHISNRLEQKPSCGVWITTFSDKKIMFTSDTQFCPRQLEDMYAKADIIFQDCETSPFRSGVHAHYDDLKTLPKETKAKMWLMHYQDGAKPDCKADGFLGYVVQGQEFNIV